jgi:hypothetical protein
MWFAIGVVVAVAMTSALSAFIPANMSGILNLAMPLVGCLVGGAIAGYSCHLGKRGIIAFASAYVVSLPIVLLCLIGIQGMSGSEGFLLMIAYFGVTGALGFALMGGVGVAIAGLGRDKAVRFAAVFGGAGFAGGFLLALSQVLSLPGARNTNQVLLVLGAIAFIVLPAAIGGSLLKRHLLTHYPVDDKTA